MSASHPAGRIQTVLGPIDPADLGLTLSHEHIMIDGSPWFLEPTLASEKHLAHEPVRLENLWWVRYHWFQNLDDVRHLDEEGAIAELTHFKRAGGGAVVELTNRGMGQDPLALARIARATGLHIVMGCGYYLARSMSPEFEAKAEEEIVEEIARDMTVGVDDTGIQAGLIGEIACSGEMDPREVKSLRAAARAQQLTGAHLHLHPDPTVFETVKVVEAAGADPARTTLAHIDVRRLLGYAERLTLLREGYTLEYDSFGREGYYPLYLRTARRGDECIDLPNDHQRINELIEMIEAGFIGQLLVSHDIWNKHHCRAYGGFGYDHLLRNALPVMRAKGLTAEQVHALLVDNPRRVLTLTG
jgi:phosphotriesterase-related protein